MRAFAVGCWLCAAVTAFGAVPPQIFKPGSFVLFQGDSITHGGRMGDMNHYLGHGYQAEIAMRYLAYRPEDGLQFANRGKSGDTSSKIWERWQDEGITVKNVENGYGNAFGIPDAKERAVRPDYVSLLCGVNDRAFWKCGEDFFRKHMTLLLESLVASNRNVKIILGEPFRCPMANDPEFFKMQATVAELAAKYGAPCVKYQRLYNETLPKIVGRNGYWSWDSVHPTYPAHMKMADLWIETVAAHDAKPETNTALVPRGKLEQDSYDWYVRHTNVIEVQRGYAKAGKGPDIVFIGDSITHFWDLKPFAGWTTLNAGFGWDRTQNVLWRLDHGLLDGISPKVVSIMIGTNNIGGSNNAPANTAEEIFAAICRIVERVQEKCPTAKVVLSNILPRGEKPDEVWRTKGQAVNKLLKARFGGDSKVAYVEAYDEFLAADGTLPKEMMPDATHPSEKGYALWAAKLLPVFLQTFPRPLPVARAPFEKVGSARQDVLILNSKYKAWTFGAFHEWAEFKFGDKSVMAAGEDQRMRLSGEYGYGANRTCGFGYIGVYDGKLVAEQSGKYLVWSVRLLCPGEVAEKDYSSTNDTLSVSREEKRIVWSRRSGGKDYSYELRATGPGKVEIAYDAALKVDVEQRIADDHGIKVVWTKPANGGRGRIEVDLGESALPREKARPMNTGLDFWANDAYDVPVRPTKNLIVNGGFEQGLRNWNNSTILNWQRSWDEIIEKQGGSNLISVVRSPRSGNWALAFAPGNIEEVRSAPFAIFPGRPYTLSWYEKTLDPAAKPRQVGFQYQKPGGSSWTDTFKYEKVACVNAPDGKTPDADGWVRRAVSFKAVKGPGVHIRFTGQNALIDDVQVEEGDRVTDFATDPVNARIQTNTKWRFFRPGQDVKATLEVGGEKGVKAAVKVEVLNIFSETVLARDYDVDFSDATLKEFPIDLSAAIAQPGMYFVRYSFDAKGLKWRDYSRFEVAEPLRNEHPTHRLFANFWFDRSALAEDSIARMVALGWGATSWMGGDFVHTKASELFRKYHVAPMLHSVGSDMNRFREKCPHYADWKAFTEKGGLRGITNVNEKALAYIRETAYCSAMDCREDDVYWALSGEEDTLASTDERADVYAHYQKAAYEGLKKGFDERGIRFHYAPTHGTVGGSIEHGIPTIERYIRSGRKIGLEYDFIGVHMSWSIDEASVASYTDRETNHADIKAMLERNGMADAPFMQAETFYLVQQYIPEWDSVDWCDNYGGGLPSQALGNREFLHAALLCRMFLIDLESWPRALTSHPWQRPFTLDREMTTYSWSHVPSVLGHLLPDPKFLGRKKLNPVIRTLGFEQSGHGVAAIWSTDHDIERGSKSCHVVRAKLPKGVRFYDMMGAERSAKVVDGVTELPVTCAPVFLVADDAAALWAAVQAAEPPKFERVVSERYFPKKQVVWRTPKCGAKPDWSKIPEIPEHPELRMHFNGRVKVAWNGEALFIRAESEKPILRIGFDGIGNARRALLEGLGPDDQVYDFRGRDIFRIKETNTQFAHNSTDKPGEDEMRRDFGRAFTPAADGKGGVWELRIVPRFLSPIQLKAGYRAGFRFDFAETHETLELGDPVDWIMLELSETTVR